MFTKLKKYRQTEKEYIGGDPKENYACENKKKKKKKKHHKRTREPVLFICSKSIVILNALKVLKNKVRKV